MTSLEQAKALATELRIVDCAWDDDIVIIQKHMDAFARIKEQNPRSGSWIDKWGACVCCDGEIPYGHSESCDIYKLERELAQLKEANRELLKDKERKNWLLSQCKVVHFIQGGDYDSVSYPIKLMIDDAYIDQALDKAALAKGDDKATHRNPENAPGSHFFNG